MKTPSTLPIITEKWRTHKTESKRVARLMAYAAEWAADPVAWNERVYRMYNCAETIDYKYCPDCGSIHIARTWLCRDRLCPICTWRLSLKRAAEMQRCFLWLSNKTDNYIPEMLTLTVKNTPAAHLSDTIRDMLDAWSKVTKRRRPKKAILGYARSLEITRNKRTGQYHPHIHVLLLRDPAHNINQSEWCTMWEEALDIDYTPVCHIERAYSVSDDGSKDYSNLSQAAIEALKYAIKSEVVKATPPDELPTLADAIKGKRLVTYGGLIKQARAALRLPADEYADLVDAFSLECPDCGCTAAILMGYRWSLDTGSYSFDGVATPPVGALA